MKIIPSKPYTCMSLLTELNCYYYLYYYCYLNDT